MKDTKNNNKKLPFAVAFIGINTIFVPYIINFYLNIKNQTPDNSAYRTTYALLNEISPILTGNADVTLGEETEIREISFGLTEEEQKNFHTNEYEIETEIESQEAILSIETASIEGPLVDGKTEEALTRGFWYLPISALPGQKGNTVIIAHRFLKVPPSKDTFFNLDKVAIGDRVVIEQRNARFTYVIAEKKIIEPTQRDVIYPTDDSRLTLITCTPLWTNTQRLVVTAILDKSEVKFDAI